MKRIRYRVLQFWLALSARLTPAELARVKAVLDPPLFALFCSMSAAEQYHAFQVWHAIQRQAGDDPDLGIAALLHDLGKARARLRIWERILIVLGRRVAPEQAARWGANAPRGWRRAFVVAAQHARWGAELAAAAGASSRAVALIQRHQDPPPSPPRTAEDRLLLALVAADDEH